MSPGLLKLGMRALVVLPVCALLPAGPEADPTRDVWAIGAPGALQSGYGLGVVAVPEPPTPLRAKQAPPAACPIDVRAIIGSDDPSDTFAVLAWGTESAVMRKGDSRKTSAGWLYVSTIRPDHVMLRRGEVTFYCPLGAGRESRRPRDTR